MVGGINHSIVTVYNSDRYIVISHLIYISPMTNKKLSAFSFAHWPFFCWEVSIWVFHPIFHWVICIFKLSCRNFFVFWLYHSFVNKCFAVFSSSKKDKPKKNNLNTNPWIFIKCFYIFIYLIFFIYKIFWQDKGKKSWALRVVQRISALTHCVTVNPEQVSHDVMNSLRAEWIS